MCDSKYTTCSKTIKTVFADLRADFHSLPEPLTTERFLNACKSAVTLMDLFGKAFAPMIYDMEGILTKLNTVFSADQENYAYLEDMLIKESQIGLLGRTRTVNGIIWIERLLRFFSTFLQLLIDDIEKGTTTRLETIRGKITGDKITVGFRELCDLMKTAYSDNLEHYHGWLGFQLCNILSRTIPNKTHMIYILANENYHCEELVLRDMKKYNRNLEESVVKLGNILMQCNMDEFL